jgi:hypothetical protein
MAREQIIQEGGRPVILRREVVQAIDRLAEDAGLLSPQGLRKGYPDRVGTIFATVSLVLSDPQLRRRLRDQVAPLVEELRAREAEKAARRERSGGRRGRPPGVQVVEVDGARKNVRRSRRVDAVAAPDVVARALSSRRRRRSSE